MKKTGKALISVLVIALLLCAVTTTALAAAAPSVSASADSADPGQEVTFTITPNNFTMMADVSVDGPLTYVSSAGATTSTDHNFIVMNAAVTYTYRVNDDAVPGTAYSFNVTNVEVADEEGTEETVAGASAGGTVAGEIPVAPEEPVPAEEPAAAGDAAAWPTKVLPAGTTYYTMVNGAPGASHTLNKATTVSVIEKLPNGYTKIMIGTTTYLVKSTTISGGASGSSSKLDKAPKTADATGTTWALAFVTIAAAAGAGLFAIKKVTAK